MGTIIEVTLGLILVYFLASIIVTQINDIVKNLLRLKSREFALELRELVHDSGLESRFVNHAVLRLKSEYQEERWRWVRNLLRPILNSGFGRWLKARFRWDMTRDPLVSADTLTTALLDSVEDYLESLGVEQPTTPAPTQTDFKTRLLEFLAYTSEVTAPTALAARLEADWQALGDLVNSSDKLQGTLQEIRENLAEIIDVLHGQVNSSVQSLSRPAIRSDDPATHLVKALIVDEMLEAIHHQMLDAVEETQTAIRQNPAEYGLNADGVKRCESFTQAMRREVNALFDDLEARVQVAFNREKYQAAKALKDTQIGEVLGAMGIDVIQGVAGIRSFRAQAEQKLLNWFDGFYEQLQRAYARRMSLVSAGVGLTLALLLNIDTLHLANTLWNDPELRQQVAAAAETAVSAAAQTYEQEAAAAGEDADSAAPEALTELDVTPYVEQAEAAIEQLVELRLPIGWKYEDLSGTYADAQSLHSLNSAVRTAREELDDDQIAALAELLNETPEALAELDDEAFTESIIAALAQLVGATPETLAELDDEALAARIAEQQAAFDEMLNDPVNTWNFTPGSNPNWFGLLLVYKLPGILITALAIRQGAPFWFDLLRRLTGQKADSSASSTASSGDAASSPG